MPAYFEGKLALRTSGYFQTDRNVSLAPYLREGERLSLWPFILCSVLWVQTQQLRVGGPKMQVVHGSRSGKVAHSEVHCRKQTEPPEGKTEIQPGQGPEVVF